MSENSLKIVITKGMKNDLEEFKTLLSEVVSSRGLTLEVTVTAQGGSSEDPDRVNVNMFNSEIADDLIFSIISHFVYDFEECLAENDEFVGVIVVAFG